MKYPPGDSERLCSIIIRTKNEERWINACLTAVYKQTYKNIEVIVVDNESQDRTIAKAQKFPITKLISIEKYLPGAALNAGIRASSGDYIVCLSAHCIPVNESWLSNLVEALDENESFAGVYGRQVPMSFTSSADKRDLLLIFGLDRKIQEKDSFFHNANSILRRSLWNAVPFDEEITNIEDRIWGQQMIDLDLKLVYEPSASVYHHHGIHQDGNVERCENVVRIIQSMQNSLSSVGEIHPNNLEIIALIPLRGNSWCIGDYPQMRYTVAAAKDSAFIGRVIVATDSDETARLAESLGAECPFLRSEDLSMDYVGMESVCRDAIDHLERQGVYPDLVVILEETFPFRERRLIDSMIEHTLERGFDSVVAARREIGSIWQENESTGFDRLDSGDVPRQYKEKSYVGSRGLCCVTRPEFLRQGNILGNNIGLFETDFQLAFFEVRDERSREIAGRLLESGFLNGVAGSSDV